MGSSLYKRSLGAEYLDEQPGDRRPDDGVRVQFFKPNQLRSLSGSQIILPSRFYIVIVIIVDNVAQQLSGALV